MSQQIKALEAQYPNGMPPDVYTTYTALIDRYNATVATERAQVASYNALLDQSNGVAGPGEQAALLGAARPRTRAGQVPLDQAALVGAHVGQAVRREPPELGHPLR